MDLNFIWKAFLMFIIGKSLLRLGGRRSISQMTPTQMAVMIGIDVLLIEPLESDNILTTLLVSLVLVFLMIISEYIEMKFDFIESIFVGKAIIVIENGKANIKNLSKLHMSLDNLEIRLRQSGISKIDDVEYATIEVNGNLGYKLKEGREPLTKDDFIALMSNVNGFKIDKQKAKNKDDIFSEIKSKKYEGNKNEP
jgi:uncharacterized membrane protein YcaP (DUF421 family)